MPFVASLVPGAILNANSSNWNLNGATDMIDALDTQGDLKTYGRSDPNDPDTGNAAASCYMTALPAYVRRITESATAPPLRIRSWWSEQNPGGGITAFVGVGYSASSDISADLNLSGGSSYEETPHDVAQNPDGPRDWEVGDFPGGSAGAWFSIAMQLAPALNQGGDCDYLLAEVRFERDQQAGIIGMLGYWVPSLGTLFGGLAHARVDMRRLSRLTGRLGWTPDLDAQLLRELRSYRWPRSVDVGATILRAQ